MKKLNKTKTIAFLTILLFSIIAMFCSSCMILAPLDTATVLYDRHTTGKSLDMLHEDYMDARRDFLRAINTDWENRSEKELISEWGVPAYSQQFDDGDKILFFEKKQVTSVTKGGTIHTYGTQFLSNSKDGRSSSGSMSSTSYKDDEITTFSETKGVVQMTISKNAVVSWKYSGRLD